MSKFTPGPWIYKSNGIHSTTQWQVEPNLADLEEGVPTTIISTFAVMGGDDVQADIRLIVKAPEMYTLLMRINGSAPVSKSMYDKIDKLLKEIDG